MIEIKGLPMNTTEQSPPTFTAVAHLQTYYSIKSFSTQWLYVMYFVCLFV